MFESDPRAAFFFQRGSQLEMLYGIHPNSVMNAMHASIKIIGKVDSRWHQKSEPVFHSIASSE